MYQIQSDAFTQRDAIEEASYLMNLAIKELADTKFEVLLCCCLSILNLFPSTSTNIFLCDSLLKSGIVKVKGLPFCQCQNKYLVFLVWLWQKNCNLSFEFSLSPRFLNDLLDFFYMKNTSNHQTGNRVIINHNKNVNNNTN